MSQRNPLVLVVNSAICSLISGSVLSTYQLPNAAKWLDTPQKAANPVSAAQASFHQAAVEQSLPSRSYTTAQINYFLEVALKSEYADSEPTIKKWDRDINIKVLGTPTPEDLKTLQAVIDELNTLVSGIRLQVVTLPEQSIQNISSHNPHALGQNPNVEIYFVPKSKFSQYEPNYQPLNYGFFWGWWNDNHAMHRSRVLISTDGVTQQERSHLIREELTQSLGLMEDSDQYSDSIFYQGWTDTNHYAEIDKVVIEMLYRPEIRPGMTQSQVLEVFQTLNARKQPTSQCGPNETQASVEFSVAPFCETQ
jgi:hypothetical protein